jgi:5-methylcytosine-specific restriction endonuclease McrA
MNVMPWYRQIKAEDVLRAIAKFDLLGRVRFLNEYGFSRVSEYYIIHEGKYFDCKPLAYGAYKILCDRRGVTEVLHHRSGGTALTVKPALEEMRPGFMVVKASNDIDNLAEEESRKRLERLKTAEKKPRTEVTTIIKYIRNTDVVKEVLYQANGVCGCCKKEAPFLDKEGEPYLEVHHIVRLADGGDDTVENAIALCPNCHREKHFG